MPKMKIQGSYLPLNAISMCTVLSKFMGKYPSDWDRHLLGISERGYNMVHFTPLMVRGASNSPYSIYDQLHFDHALFPNGEQDIADLVSRMENQYGLLALTDVVWNHTAHNSKWLQEHPEAGYSVKTAPHLESASDLDLALLEFSNKMGSLGYPTDIRNDGDLVKIMDGIKQHCISKVKLWEFYIINQERDTEAVVRAWKEGQVSFPDDNFMKLGMRGIQDVQNWSLDDKAQWLMKNAMSGTDRMGERFRRKIDALRGAALLSALLGRYDSRTHDAPDERVAHGTMFRLIEEINLHNYREYDADCGAIMEQVFNRIKYMRLDGHGPKLGPVTKDNPLIEPYFTRLPHNETTRKHDPRSLMLVNNGWVWAADAMRDNAGPTSRAYLRREVIIWGDCVKLRYGTCRDDNPYLWDYIAQYTRLMAKYFAGFRIDNCHSTPIKLAQYMLDEARRVNPNLCVVAELFSGSEDMDFRFVKELGLSCLIREAMQAWSTQELSRLCHRHMGLPIGSFETDEVINTTSQDDAQTNGTNGATSGRRELIRVIKQSPVHALFMDCTHDNETPAQKRDARDTLPNAALVAMCSCATGSVFGYDEVYPELIELVHEKRLYTSPYSNGQEIKVQAAGGGIGNIKKVMNQIHVLMGKDEYDETYLHHDNEYITVHRQHPSSRKGYYLIAHTAFPGYGNGNGGFAPQTLPGTRAKLIGTWMLDVDASSEAKSAAIHDTVLRGLPSKTKDIRGMQCEWRGKETVITVPATFPPGSIAIFETWIPGAEHSEGLDKFVTRGAGDACKSLSLSDLNFLMYRADAEERDTSGGQDGTYNIPGYGNAVYCGMQGWWSILCDVVRDNNLGHPLCQHLRDGTWALDYTVGRLQKASKQKKWANLREPAHWLQDRFAAIRKLPTFLCPRYFAMAIQTIYNAGVDRCIELMSSHVRDGQDFVRSLGLVSVQVTGHVNSAGLWPDNIKQSPSLAAGLPYFAVEWARCWGRDIMIAMRGLLIATGRYDAAKDHILAFASVLKHGMIPNLLNKGTLPRYNSRDSVWFFLQCIQDYYKISPDGSSLLQASVKRRFLPYDDTWFPVDDPRAYSQSSTIEDIIQEVLQRHASGLSFVEHNAGSDLDSQMKEPGFHIDVKVDWSNGMIFGGNPHNCGTWMDKMGSSDKAGNRGIPGTPRDGASVEITGLVYGALTWLDNIRQQGQYSYDGVSLDDRSLVAWSDWAGRIKANFERCYYIPRNKNDDSNFDINSAIVNRRGIYKDLYRSSKEYEDYQLRPNYPIAMTVAPDLFDPPKALYAIYMADTILRGPQGMATLDPSDYNYRPYYINSDDSNDFATAQGRNYHQGPEWLWPTAFFLRALLKFDLMRKNTPDERVESFQQVTQRLKGCMDMIKTSPWAGLTELTNKNGAFCGDSV